jgi:hypothetical protein
LLIGEEEDQLVVEGVQKGRNLWLVLEAAGPIRYG